MRRVVVFAVLLLVLGLTTTVAVAWLYAGIAHPALAENRLSKWTSGGWSVGNGWHVREWNGPGKRSRLMRPLKEKPWATPGVFYPPTWSAATRPADATSVQIFEDERGWPFLSLRCSWKGDQPFSLPNEPIHGGVSIRAFSPDWMIKRPQIMVFAHPDFDYIFIDEHRALPLIPIWPGFVGSTLFFFLLWSLVILFVGGVTSVRRFLRQRKNRCVRCGYLLHKLESNICPECGWSIGRRVPLISGSRVVVAACFAALMLVSTAVLGIALIDRFEGPSPIHVAAATNDVDELKRILASGGSVDQRLPRQGMRNFQEGSTTPLMWASARGNLEAAMALLDASAQIDVDDEWGTTALKLATQYRHDAVVKLLLERGAASSMKSQVGQETLSTAAAHGTPETLQMLIDAGAELDRVEGAGWPTTALGWAASTGRVDNMRFLINAGAAVNPEGGNSPLILAIKGKHHEAAKLLLESGAAIDNSVGQLLWEASEHNMTETARILIEKGADPNAAHPVAKGWTPVRRAVIRSNLELAKMLVAAGADPHTTDQNGESILFQINWNDAPPELFDYLLGLGIDINQQSDAGHTVLMQQVHRRHVAAVKRLLEAGADVSIQDKQGMSAIDYAEKQLTYSTGMIAFQGGPVNLEVVRLLRDRIDG